MQTTSLELWTALKDLEEYIRDGIVRQMNGATSFGGDDMVPLKSAYLTCERLKPVLSLPLYQGAKEAVNIATSGLNGMLDAMRKAVSGPPHLIQTRLRIASDSSRADTLLKYRQSLAILELLVAKEGSHANSSPTINLNGPVYGQLNVAGANINGASLSITIGELVSRIETSDASPEEKKDAKSKLNAFLSHPLVTSVLGGISSGIVA